jgi:DnaJ domain/PilZ domain
MRLSGSEMRRMPRRKPFVSQQGLKLKSKAVTGGATEVDAWVVDISEGGIGVEVESPLRTGSIVDIVGQIEPAIRPGPLGRRCRVCWCSTSTNGDGRYHAGLSFEPAAARSGADSPVAQTEDYYEILQLSCNADPDTIHRVFRLMAQRYHPDNQDTGSSDLFRQIKEAYEVLSDPERRAAFDAQLTTNRQRRFKIFHSVENSRGVEAEKRKRHGILSLLYGKRLTEPDQPFAKFHP